MAKFYITTPIYYVNDKPHVGHAYTTVAADVLARWHRLNGDEVFFLTGTDEHGAKVAQSARQAGLEPQAFCDQNSALFKTAFEKLDVSFDIFFRTTDERHKTAVAKFLTVLYDQRDIYSGVYEGLYCTGCEKFLTEKELVNNLCPDHQTPPEKVSEHNYFFKLNKYLPEVRRLIESDALLIQPAERKNEVLGLFDQGLPDFSVSREKVDWGIPLPFDSKQKTYVWVEALQNYTSAIGYGDDKASFKKWWPADLHLMAKDILKFHAVYWPALLIAAGLPTPKKVFAHGFFTINGQKMSKSLGNVIDPNELVKKYGSDAARFLLLNQYRFGQDGDLNESSFAEQYEAALVSGLGNLVARTEKMIEQYLAGQIDRSVKPETEFNSFKAKYQTELETINLQGALKTIQAAVSYLDSEIERVKPWSVDEAERPAILKPFLSGLAVSLIELAGLVEPFMPQAGQAILERFSRDRIAKGSGLFPRLK